MKYENLQKCTELCARIKTLRDTLDRLDSRSQRAVIISSDYMASDAIIKEWTHTKGDAQSETGLYDDLITEFLNAVRARIRERMADLQSQLNDL